MERKEKNMKKRTVRKIALILALVMAALTLSSCGNSCEDVLKKTMKLVRKGDVDGIIDLLPDDFVEDMFDINEFYELQSNFEWYTNYVMEKDRASNPDDYMDNWSYTVDSMEYYKKDRIKMKSFTSSYPYSVLEYNSLALLRDVCVANCTVSYTRTRKYGETEKIEDIQRELKITFVNVSGKWFPVKFKA